MSSKLNKTVKYQMVPSSNRYPSKAKYLEHAVESGVSELLPEFKGHKKLVDLLEALDEFREMNVNIPSGFAGGETMVDSDLDKRPKFDLSDEAAGKAEILHHSSNCSLAEVKRMAIIFTVGKGIQNVDGASDTDKRKYRRARSQIRNVPIRLRNSFNSEISLHFGRNFKQTKNLILLQPMVAEELEEEYKDGFEDSEIQEKLMDNHDEKPYQRLQTTIDSIRED